MRNIFNLDSGFSRFLTVISDLFTLNILWIICSIPIITIGASTTALYSVNLKLINNDECYIIKSFFKAFKENFKKSTIVWISIVLISVILGVNLSFWLKFDLSISFFALPFILFTLFIFLLATPYIFLMLTKTKCSIITIIKYSFFSSLKNLPYSLAILLLEALFIIATIRFPIVSFFMIFWGISLNAYIVSHIFVIVYNKNNTYFDKIFP